MQDLKEEKLKEILGRQIITLQNTIYYSNTYTLYIRCPGMIPVNQDDHESITPRSSTALYSRSDQSSARLSVASSQDTILKLIVIEKKKMTMMITKQLKSTLS